MLASEGALAGFGREAAGVDEPDDFAGVGGTLEIAAPP
jgi:hypothetical protein